MSKEKVKSQKSKVKTSKKKLKAAVIGVGAMGRHHVRNYFEMPFVDLVAIADLNKEVGARLAKKYSARFYESFEQFLEKEKPDLVSICVPTAWHRDVALKVMQEGSHLLIEKPIAADLSQAKEMVEAAKKHGLKLTVGHIERFNPAILKLKELIKKGKLGTIVSVMARRASPIPARIKDANVILDIGVHDIDLINFILEKTPVTVHAYGGRALLQKQEDYADILLEYAAGKEGLKVTGHIQTNWLTPVKIRKLNLTGTGGYAVLNLITQEIYLFNTKYTQEFDDYSDYVGKFREAKGKLLSVKKFEPLRAELEDFVDSIRKNRLPLVSSEDGYEALKVALTATERIKEKS